jgi:PAS domain-containing protein
MQKSGGMRGTFTVERSDAGERIVEFSAVSDIVRGQHLAILRDVTERSEREAVLDKARQMLELGLETTDTGVFEWSIEIDRVYWKRSLLYIRRRRRLPGSPPQFQQRGPSGR